MNEFTSPQNVKEAQAITEEKKTETVSYAVKGNGRRSSIDEPSDLSEQEDDIEGKEKESTATRSSRGNSLRNNT